jgi:hypothetical protein
VEKNSLTNTKIAMNEMAVDALFGVFTGSSQPRQED